MRGMQISTLKIFLSTEKEVRMLLKIQKSIKPDLWIFDNDGTLYPNPKNIERSVVALMTRYIMELYGIYEDEGHKKRRELLEKHKTKYTLVALKNEGVDESHFIQNTYLAVKPEEYGIIQNPKLQKLISSLKGEKIVMTNNPSQFAELILKSLGIKDLFSQVVGIQELNYIQKPNIKAFKILESFLKNGRKIVFIDNELDNIKTAKNIGCKT
ncbi:HAD family hydrolase, partial [Patescibacteria group bacterium]